MDAENLNIEDERAASLRSEEGLEQTLDGLLSLAIDNAATLSTLVSLQVRILSKLEDMPYEELLEEVNDLKKNHHRNIMSWLQSDPMAFQDEGDEM